MILRPPTWSHLVDASTTYGAEVAELSAVAGLVPDPEQRLVLDQVFAERAPGVPSAFEVGLVAPRQNLKTGTFKMCALGWLFLMDQRLVIWSAHEFSTAQEAFRDMCELVESTPALDRKVKAISRGNGDEAIELLSGCRLKFKARTKSGGRGLTGDKIVLDEAFALQPSMMGALLPTLSTRRGAQVVYGSSAGTRNSDVLRGIRDKGRGGKSVRLAYLEWGDPDPGGCAIDGCEHDVGTPGCALDDRSRWSAAMPALGRRVPVDIVEAFRNSGMPAAEFAREFLGWWDEPVEGSAELTGEQWAARRTDAGPTGAVSLAADVAPNGTWAAVVACGAGVVELVEHRRGTAWLPARLVEIMARQGIDGVAVDPAGPIGSLLPDLDRAGVAVHLLDGRDAVRACGAMASAVTEGTVSHRGEPAFLAAIGGASRRAVGDGWKWSRKDSTVDVSPLVAATYAHWQWLSRAGDYEVLASAY